MDLENILLNIDTLIETFLMELGMLGGILACLLIIVESMLPVLPLFVFITLAFYTFGNWIGFFICWICTCTGCFISFALFRSKIKNWFEKRIAKPGSKTRKLMKYIDKMSFASLATLVAIPFTPAFTINIAAGLSNMSFKKFSYAMLVGKLFMVYFWGYIGTTLVESLTHPIYLVKIILMLVGAFVLSKIVTKYLNID